MAASYNELFGLGTHSEDASLVRWYPLQDDAASTVVTDNTGNSNGTLQGGDNTATISGTGPTTEFPWLSKALDLDGSADYITLTSVSLSGASFSVGFRGYNDTTSGDRWGYCQAVEGTNQFLGLGLRSSNRLGVSFWANDLAGATTVGGPSAWRSYAVTYNATSNARELWLNGSSDGSDTSAADIGSSSTTGHIGRRITSTGYWNGRLCDVFIFSRQLTSAEIADWDAGPEPINTVAPAMTGTETVGQVLTSTSGTWGLDSPFSGGTNGTVTYAYQWTRSNDAGGSGEADISGATSSTYTLVSADSGKFVRCRVRATNSGGFDSAADTNSNMSGAISGGASALPSPPLVVMQAVNRASTY